MSYRLKDRELQKKLDDISGGDFSRRLESNEKRICINLKIRKRMNIWFRKSEGPLRALEITPDMIEEVREYDPHKWNSFPEVTPPEGVLMRVECRDGRKACAKYRLFIEGGSWCDINGGAWPEAYSQDVERFRPWEDKE